MKARASLGLAATLAVALALLMPAVPQAGGKSKAPAVKQDVPLNVNFINDGSQLLYGDGRVYQDGARDVVARIQFLDYDTHGIGGGFAFKFGSRSGRTVTFNLGQWLPLDQGNSCPDRCPGPPVDPSFDPALFNAETVREFSFNSAFGYAPPNYDFLNPTVCPSGWVADESGLYCPTDLFRIRIYTAEHEYLLRMSPNLQATFAPNTMDYGVVKVRYFASENKWTLEPLLSYDFGGATGLIVESCPAQLELREVVQGRSKYTFLGCYDLPFLMELQKR